MKGSYRIKVSNKRVKYDFAVNRNITILQGDSASGKTTLIGLISDYYEAGRSSGVHLECKKQCVVLRGKGWQDALEKINDSIVFIDEGNKFVTSKDFAKVIQNTDNYYVIITREDLHSLPYSINEIYGIHEVGSKRVGEPVYNGMYKIYGELATNSTVNPTLVITEDSNSGYEFFKSVCDSRNLACESADGKSNVVNCIMERPGERVLLIADGAAFGPEMRKVMQSLKWYKNYVLYLPESFEWLILKSDLFRADNLQNILENPSEYIESKDYFSWENYFTALLEKITAESEKVAQYSKKHISPFYTTPVNSEKILSRLKNIKLL